MRESITKIYKRKERTRESGNGNCSFKSLFGLKEFARGSMDEEKQTERVDRDVTGYELENILISKEYFQVDYDSYGKKRNQIQRKEGKATPQTRFGGFVLLQL